MFLNVTTHDPYSALVSGLASDVTSIVVYVIPSNALNGYDIISNYSIAARSGTNINKAI